MAIATDPRRRSVEAYEPRSGGNPRQVTPEGEVLVLAWLDDNPAGSQHKLVSRFVHAG